MAISRIHRVWGQADYVDWLPVAWLALCVLVVFWKPAVWLLAAACLAAQVVLGGNEGTLVIMWVAIAVGLFRGEQLVTALRALTVTVYLFAAAHKAFYPFFSGAILASASWLPAPEIVAPTVVIGEAVLGVLVWRRSRLAFPIAVALHLGIVLFLNFDWDPEITAEMVPLVGFNVVLIALVWLTTRYSDAQVAVVDPEIVEGGDRVVSPTL